MACRVAVGEYCVGKVRVKQRCAGCRGIAERQQLHAFVLTKSVANSLRVLQVDALTPDIRDSKTHTLYDCTVNSLSNPTVYVTYHDAQAYPEVN